MFAGFLLSSLLLFQAPTVSPRPAEPQPTRPSPAATPDQKEDPPVVSKHSARIGGRQLNYTVTTGFMPIKNSVSGEVEARLFYMAYTLDNPPANRPLMISFNGGPGSASVWLHMGALGPRRVKMLDDGLMPPAPYETVDNESSWLDQTDIIFVDPVGTGYSRAARPDLASKFFSVNGDIESIGEFIRMYLGRSERWHSPLYLVGESYGTTRAAGLSNHLFERGIAVNGILLISTVLNFQSIRFADNNDLPLILIFPSYTATAWYHKQLPVDLQARPLRDVLKESEAFATNEFAPAMLKIDRLSASEKSSLLDKFSRYSGLSRDFVDENNFRVDLDEFNKELLRKQRRSTGRLDSRFQGFDKDSAGEGPDFDPSMTAIRTPYTAVFNDYVRRELNFKSDLEYYILGGGISSPWNWNTNNQYADTSQALSAAMRKNPYMKVFVASGYYDMATPYFAAEYTIAALNLDPQLRRNFSFAYYEAGHMMYIEKNSLRKLKEDISAFMQTSAKR
ncbi:MAG: peptidase S10 [Pyrinomonadaceae bacterium]